MLTKEECIEALSNLRTRTVVDRVKGDYRYYHMLINDYAEITRCFEELINEHFELLEKYQNLQDENARSSFDKIVNNIEDMNYKLWLENPPLKFEELEQFMWVWDDHEDEYIQLTYCDYRKEWVYEKIGVQYEIEFIFEENRFYRREVK